MDKIGQNWTKWTNSNKMYRIRQKGQNWTNCLKEKNKSIEARDDTCA